MIYYYCEWIKLQTLWEIIGNSYKIIYILIYNLMRNYWWHESQEGDKIMVIQPGLLKRDASIALYSLHERPSEITSRRGKTWPTLRSFAKYFAVTFTLVQWTYSELTVEVTRNTFLLFRGATEKSTIKLSTARYTILEKTLISDET